MQPGEGRGGGEGMRGGRSLWVGRSQAGAWGTRKEENDAERRNRALPRRAWERETREASWQPALRGWRYDRNFRLDAEGWCVRHVPLGWRVS